MADSHTSSASGGTELRRDAIGLREVLFQSITDMAPGAAIAASIPAGVAFAGGALPLAVVFALIASLFTAWTDQPARQGDTRGRIAGDLRRPRHPPGRRVPGRVGLCHGRLAGRAAGAAAARLHDGRHAEHRVRLARRTCGGRGRSSACSSSSRSAIFGIRASARLGTILGIFEIAVFLIMGVLLVFHAGSHNTLSVFTTKYTPAGQYHGLSGVIAGSVFTIAGVPRLRERSAAGRGGAQPAADRAARRAAVDVAHRRPVRVHHLRDRRRRSGLASSRPSRPAPAPRPGRAWRGRCTACSGCWSSSRSSTRRSPTPTPA